MQRGKWLIVAAMNDRRRQLRLCNRCLGRLNIQCFITRASCIFPVRQSAGGFLTSVELIGQGDAWEIHSSFLTPRTEPKVSTMFCVLCVCLSTKMTKADRMLP